jgi:hypothetical protein
MRMTETSEIERVYREAGHRLWWALLAYTGDREMASDAVAEAFARALTASDTIRDPAAWVWRVAFRVATTHLREPRGAAGRPETSYEMEDRVVEVMLAVARCRRPGSPRQPASRRSDHRHFGWSPRRDAGPRRPPSGAGRARGDNAHPFPQRLAVAHGFSDPRAFTSGSADSDRVRG